MKLSLETGIETWEEGGRSPDSGYRIIVTLFFFYRAAKNNLVRNFNKSATERAESPNAWSIVASVGGLTII